MATSHSQLDCPKATANGYMKLRISLAHTNISRIIAVPEHMTLADLNDAIQAVMGWDDSHLWHFTDCKRDGAIYELPHEDNDFPAFSKRLTIDASKIALRKVFPNKGAKLYYEYDFGDGWDHLITRQTDPKTPGIACVKTTGPDGIEDFGGPWRLGAFIAAMHKDPDAEEFSEIRGWAELDDAEDLKEYLQGESAAEKTRKLRAALSHVKPAPKSPVAQDEKPMSEDEKAHTLGLVFALLVSSKLWKILEDALRNGGTCEFDDPDKDIGEFFLTMFDGLKVKDGRSSVFHTNPSKLTVLPEWVEMYKKYGEEWRKIHEQFDIMESYASSAVHLYGVVTLDELHDISLRYDPGCHLTKDEMCKIMDSRSISCPQMSFRVEGDLVVCNETFPMDVEGIVESIAEIRERHREYPRWYPETRGELFMWEDFDRFMDTPESERVERLLHDVCRGEDVYDEDETLLAIYHMLAQTFMPEEAYGLLREHDALPKLGEKKKRELLDAMGDWSEVIHMPYFNGNTIKDIRARAALV